MGKYFSKIDIPFASLAFIIPLVLFVLTSSHSLMFDDAAEFSLVVSLGSVAHPPGTPSYVLSGFIWTKMLSLFGMNVVDALTLFSSICISLGSVLLYFIFRMIISGQRTNREIKDYIICLSCALAYATAATTWAWANTVEVYSFQSFAMALTLFGLTSYHFERKKYSLILSALGIAAGLSNHHLTMILFLPFTPLFFTDILFSAEKIEKKKKVKRNSMIKDMLNVVGKKDFIRLAGLSFAFTFIFYGWMYLRAQNDFQFMFGKPDSIGELFYHMGGGSYSRNISSTSEGIISSRLPYFLWLTAMQLFVFLPFFILGLLTMKRRGAGRLLFVVMSYFILLFLYQLNNNQWSSTDAYMLLPFMMLMIVVFYGAIAYPGMKVHVVLPALLCIQIAYNYPNNDRKTYPVSASLMELLDKSAPKNSIILIADWSSLIQYYYYRIVENFRPDLVVLNYDFKFTYYKILPVLYPSFYEEVKPEYDTFVRELENSNPHQVRNTGCDLTTPALTNSFRMLLNKIEDVARKQGRQQLSDPRANYFYTQNKFYSPNRFVSGCFSSSMPGSREANENFVALDFPFMHSSMLLTDPAALDKLVDFQAMLDQHISFYQANNDSINLVKAQDAHQKVITLQRKMKEKMSFAYKVE